MLRLENANLIFHDTDDGGAQLVIDHGGVRQAITFTAAARSLLGGWLLNRSLISCGAVPIPERHHFRIIAQGLGVPVQTVVEDFQKLTDDLAVAQAPEKGDAHAET